jgi:hypothetical protein
VVMLTLPKMLPAQMMPLRQILLISANLCTNASFALGLCA